MCLTGYRRTYPGQRHGSYAKFLRSMSEDGQADNKDYECKGGPGADQATGSNSNWRPYLVKQINVGRRPPNWEVRGLQRM